MSRSIYNVIELLRNFKTYSGCPGKKKFQKIIYLVENLGAVDLGLDYEIHFYGPYSSKLENILDKLEGEGLIHYDYQGHSHLICVEDPNEDTDFCETDLKENEIKRIEKIYSRFASKSPSDLELLATTHFAFSKLQNKSADSVANGIKKIKGSKYSDLQIQQAITELNLKVI